ncbi:dihydroorotate dehydrogenase electron transfer subunit [Thermodesulfobacteriota bacterium]
MQVYKESAEIVSREQVAEDIFRFTVKSPDIASTSWPGQFVMVKTGEGLDPLLRRPFSIHQVLSGGLVRILFKVIGKGTRALAVMEKGSKLDLLGPVGRGFVIADNCQHILVGGGIGIAPLLFLAGHILAKKDSSPVRVLLGARTKDEIFTLKGDFENMGLEVDAITEDGTLGKQGLVTDLMMDLQQEKPVMIYGCGPYPMLRAVAGTCRKNNWKCQVSLETMMACGLAACLGCAVLRADMKGYVHACKDGPVFDADDVAWL